MVSQVTATATCTRADDPAFGARNRVTSRDETAALCLCLLSRRPPSQGWVERHRGSRGDEARSECRPGAMRAAARQGDTNPALRWLSGTSPLSTTDKRRRHACHNSAPSGGLKIAVSGFDSALVPLWIRCQFGDSGVPRTEVTQRISVSAGLAGMIPPHDPPLGPRPRAEGTLVVARAPE
jgi:hypothetical protein